MKSSFWFLPIFLIPALFFLVTAYFDQSQRVDRQAKQEIAEEKVIK